MKKALSLLIALILVCVPMIAVAEDSPIDAEVEEILIPVEADDIIGTWYLRELKAQNTWFTTQQANILISIKFDDNNDLEIDSNLYEKKIIGTWAINDSVLSLSIDKGNAFSSMKECFYYEDYISIKSDSGFFVFGRHEPLPYWKKMPVPIDAYGEREYYGIYTRSAISFNETLSEEMDEDDIYNDSFILIISPDQIIDIEYNEPVVCETKFADGRLSYIDPETGFPIFLIRNVDGSITKDFSALYEGLGMKDVFENMRFIYSPMGLLRADE